MFLNTSFLIFSNINLPKITIPWIVGMSSVAGTTIAITKIDVISNKFKEIFEPVKDSIKSVWDNTLQHLTTPSKNIFKGSKEIVSKYKEWGSFAYSPIQKIFESIDSSNFKNGFTVIVSNWSNWFNASKEWKSIVEKAVTKIFEYISDWLKVKDILKMIPLLIASLLAIFDYFSMFFKKEVMKQEVDSKENKKVEEAKAFIEQVKQMAAQPKPSVWQSIWTLISGNMNVISSVELGHITEVFKMTRENEDYFIKRVKELSEGTRKYRNFEWGSYDKSESLVEALKHESFMESVMRYTILGIDSISECKGGNCKDEEKIKEFGNLLLETSASIVEGFFGFLRVS